jgi:hypothetical protein
MTKCSVCLRQTVASAGLIGTLAELGGEAERPSVMGERCPRIASCCAGVPEAKPCLELEVAIANPAGTVKGLLKALDGLLVSGLQVERPHRCTISAISSAS